MSSKTSHLNQVTQGEGQSKNVDLSLMFPTTLG